MQGVGLLCSYGERSASEDGLCLGLDADRAPDSFSFAHLLRAC